MDTDGRGGVEECEGVEGGETVFKLYCMRKKSMFNKRKKRKKIKYLFNF